MVNLLQKSKIIFPPCTNCVVDKFPYQYFCQIYSRRKQRQKDHKQNSLSSHNLPINDEIIRIGEDYIRIMRLQGTHIEPFLLEETYCTTEISTCQFLSRSGFLIAMSFITLSVVNWQTGRNMFCHLSLTSNSKEIVFTFDKVRFCFSMKFLHFNIPVMLSRVHVKYCL